jgi:hypothetical protein
LSTRAPSAEDDVVFDSASNATAYTVTISNNTTVCRNVTIAGPASGNLTLAGSGSWFIHGNLSFPATGFTRSYTGQLQFWGSGSHTINTNGVSLTSVLNFNGTGTYTLQSALSTSGTTTLNAGVFDTNGQTFSCGQITATASVLPGGTLSLGASTVTASTISANRPITIIGGTSNLTLTAANPNIGGANFTGGTFYNVNFSSTSVTSSVIRGANTFNNLTFATPATARTAQVTIYGNQTINGTLTIPGQASIIRYLLRSENAGSVRTLTVNAAPSLTDVDFWDIAVVGTAAPLSGTRLGDCGGNTGITFPAPKTVYWNNTAGGAWSSTSWATSSGGSVAAANFPLAQDTAIIDDTGLSTGSAITGTALFSVGTVTSTKTNAYTFNPGTLLIGNDLTLTPSTTTSGLSATFIGRATQNITSAGNTTSSITVQKYNSQLKLLGALTCTVFNLSSGGVDTNNQNLTMSSSSNWGNGPVGSAATVTLGSSTITTAGSFGGSSIATIMTVDAGTSTITLTSTSSRDFGFGGQNSVWNNVVFAGDANGHTIQGNNTFNNLTFPARAQAGVRSISFAGDQTITGTLALGGGTANRQRAGFLSSAIGTQRTITAAAITGLANTDFRDIVGAGAATWTGGTSIGDLGNNSGIGVDAPKTVYWVTSGPSARSWSSDSWATASDGSPLSSIFPLAQDTVIFDDAFTALQVNLDVLFNIGTVDASSRTLSLTFNVGVIQQIYGDFTLGSGVTPAGFSNLLFLGRGNQTYTTAGKTIPWPLFIEKSSGTFQHGDAYTSSSGVSIAVTQGNYATGNYNISLESINTSSPTASITLGTSTLTLRSSLPINFDGRVNLTFSGAASTINLSNAGAKTFAGGGFTFGTVSSTAGTTSALTITGNNTFGTLTNSAYTFLAFASGSTQTITNFTYTGAVGNVVRWSTSIPGQRATLKQSETGGSLAAVGANSVDGGNNSGLTFTGASPDYLYIRDIAYSAFTIPATSSFFMLF